ncbi:hypothetical protein IGJ47_001929 [Enterococcus sp. AZ172]
MQFYFFNDNVDEHNRHEVHTDDCKFLPEIFHRTYIGLEDSCRAAITIAKKEYPEKSFDGCYYCCRLCHKG